MSAAPTAAGPTPQDTVHADVHPEDLVQEGVLARLLRRTGRTIARPALECYEMLVDGATPHQARLTVLAALTYLMVPLDLIPDFLPAAGFSDDLVALTALLGLCSRHITPAIRTRAKDRLDQWFPLDGYPRPTPDGGAAR